MLTKHFPPLLPFFPGSDSSRLAAARLHHSEQAEHEHYEDTGNATMATQQTMAADRGAIHKMPLWGGQRPVKRKAGSGPLRVGR